MTMNGDVILRTDGGQTTLRLDFNAMCAFEGQTGKSALVWIGAFERGEVDRADEMRAMVWAMMLRHRPETWLEWAGEILDQHPDILARVISAAVPDAEAKAGSTPAKKQRAPSIWRRCFKGGSRSVLRLISFGRRPRAST